MEKESQVLVVFPHPDDEAFGVSGTIAKYTGSGTRVTYACMTLGEMGRNLGNPPFTTREKLPIIRKMELQEAAAAIGIQDLRMMGLRDKTVEFEDEDQLANRITNMINELHPSLIITFYPGYSVHPDHEACGRAVVKAVSRMDRSERPKLHCVAFSNGSLDELGQPDIVNDVSTVFDQKMAALRAHRSQTQGTILAWEDKLKNGPKEEIDTLKMWLNNERFYTYKWAEEI